jgi:hypothetical protein
MVKHVSMHQESSYNRRYASSEDHSKLSPKNVRKWCSTLLLYCKIQKAPIWSITKIEKKMSNYVKSTELWINY